MIQHFIWYSKWRWWKRCKAVGRSQITLGYTRCALYHDHEGDCAAYNYDAHIVRFSTMWTWTHR